MIMQQNTHHGSQDLKESPNSLKLKLVNSINDQESKTFLRKSGKALSYALTGSTSEQILAFVWGPGSNGKSVFLNTVTKFSKLSPNPQ